MHRLILLLVAALSAPLTVVPQALAHPPGEAHPGDPHGPRNGTVKLGEIARVHPGILVRPLALVEDSRCPINALCIQAGRLVLRIELTVRGRKSEHLLTLQAPAKLAGGTLNLVSAQPHPGAVTPHPPPHEMRFGFSYRPDSVPVRADQ